MHSEQDYQRVKEAESLLELKQIKQSTDQIMNDLETIEEQKQIKNLKLLGIQTKFIGRKIDSLVLKFIANLKKSVLLNKDRTIQKYNDKQVNEILKHRQYNNQYKHTEVPLSKKESIPPKPIWTV